MRSMRSDVLYLRLPRAEVAFFRFLLEASDGLALFTSLGADAAGREVLCLRFAPGSRRDVLRMSGRLGLSLGLDLLGARICSMWLGIFEPGAGGSLAGTPDGCARGP